MKVFCYRNLHKKGNVWSVRDVATGLVVDHVEKIIMKDVTLKVSEAGRQRVLKEKRKNVHAGVQGTRIFMLPKKGKLFFQPVFYNPYKVDSFVDRFGNPVHKCRYAMKVDDRLMVCI